MHGMSLCTYDLARWNSCATLVGCNRFWCNCWSVTHVIGRSYYHSFPVSLVKICRPRSIVLVFPSEFVPNARQIHFATTKRHVSLTIRQKMQVNWLLRGIWQNICKVRIIVSSLVQSSLYKYINHFYAPFLKLTIYSAVPLLSTLHFPF